ncbi:Solute carrier organic anion transporter family member 4C1 [Nymphon striatum]|nr:Solute carrier organic anion transporter family member 4C1 [Nymphon striatum]
MGTRNEKKTRPASTYSFTQVASQDGYDPEDDSLSTISEDEKCGIWCWKPEFLQWFSRPTVFLVVFCCIGLVQGAFFTYFVGVITTVEKRYAFKSKVTGIISIADNLSPVIISLLVGYFGGAGHRTRWVAFGTLIAAFSAFISSLPYFLFGPSEQLLGSSNTNLTVNSTANIGYQLCSPNERIDICEAHASRRTRETLPAVSLLFLGNFINGIGSTAFYIVGTPYLDDNIDKAKTPIYFVDPGIDKADPRWIGAWWIGFNVIALLLLVSGSLLALFPKKLKWRSDKKSQIDDVTQPSKKSMSEKFKEFPITLSLLFKNPILMCQNLSLVFYLLGVLGFFLFLPKYFESQFRQPSQKANVISGMSTVAFMAVGFLASGYVIYKFKPSARILSGWNVFLGFVHVASMIALANIGCTQNTIATTDSCMEDCRCTNQVFSPVCYSENTTTYFSPCHAGCSTSYFDDKKRVFDNCECTDSVVKTGFCDEGCSSMMLYIVILAVSKLIGSTGRIGNALITLRCVSPELKSLALSTGSFLLSLFAFIPYPLIYGALVDSVCIEWEETCGEVGNCWIYDSEQFRYRFHGLTGAFYLCAVFFDMIVWHYSNNIKSLYEDPESLHENKRKLSKENTLNDTIRFDSNFKKKIMGSRKEKKARPVSTYSFTQVASQDGYDPEDDSLSSISEDEKCGIWCWKPEFLQCFSRPIVFLIVFCFIGLIQGAFFTYFVGVITTVEKRYAFKSKVTGIISIADNLSPVIISLLVGYFGGAGHRTRWVAFGTLIAAFSAFISSLPYFLFGPSEQLSGSSSANLTVNSTENIGYQLCSLNERIDMCEEHASRRTRETLPAVSLLFLGNFINGIGSTAFYIVGTPYLDDNIDKVKTPIYFVDPGIDKADPRWIGAWWIGFNVIALLLLVAGSLLALFPKKLKWRSDKKSQLDDVIQPSKKSISEKFKEFPKTVSILFKNPILMCQNLSLIFYLLGVLGFFLFLPKYFESQFRQPSQKANVISGLATVSLMAVGFLVSGFVIYKFKPSARILSGWNVFLGFVQVASMIALANIGCTQNTIATTDSCMEDCRCTNQVFTPVCYSENTTTHFSPCHAGCTTTYFEDKNRVFDNCECTDSIMKTGFCDEGCNSMMLYIAIMAVSKLIGSTGRIGNTLITLRCVSPELKSLALSTGSFLLSLFAFIPYPLIYGALVDSVCIEWEDTCGEIGNCWIYDSEQFRYRFHGLTGVFYVCAVFFDMIVCYYSKNIKSLYEDPESLHENKRKISKENTLNDTIRYNWAGSKSSIAGMN